MQQPILTIAIPTYNRCETLCANIKRLVPQLNSDVCLLVIDNASTDATGDLETWITLHFPLADINVIHNPANIGAGANVTRCFEYAQTPWVWTLMDDDPVHPDAISGILAAIMLNPSAASINMQSTAIPEAMRRPTGQNITCSSVKQLAESLDFMPNLLLSSTGVHRVAPARAVLQKAYISLNTVAPHVAIMLSTLDAGLGEIVLSGHTVVTYNYNPDEVWPTEVWLAVADVFTLVRDQQARALLLRKYTDTHPGWMDTSKLLRILFPMMLQPTTRQMAISDYLHAWSKRIQFTRKPAAILFALFVFEVAVIAAMVCFSALWPFRRQGRMVISNALLRTAIDGNA